MILCIKI